VKKRRQADLRTDNNDKTTNTLMAATTLRPFESMQDLEKEMARRRMTTPTPPPIKGELLQEQQAQRRFLRSRGKDGYQATRCRRRALRTAARRGCTQATAGTAGSAWLFRRRT
jgi:hypothetical protein